MRYNMNMLIYVYTCVCVCVCVCVCDRVFRPSLDSLVKPDHDSNSREKNLNLSLKEKMTELSRTGSIFHSALFTGLKPCAI